MRIQNDWQPVGQPIAAALGSFDGLHRGHCAVVEKVLDRPGEMPAVDTFDQNPSAVLCGRSVPLLMTNGEMARQLQKMGVGALYLLPFSHICHLPPEAFYDRLAGTLQVKTLSCGFNFRFGEKGAGDTDLLQRLCDRDGIRLFVSEAVRDQGEPVSSTRIRRMIENGDMKSAARLLGRPFSFCFPVEHGRMLGRTLGIPTINQAMPPNFILPPFGVYASVVTVEGKRYTGVTNIGVKPTVGSDHVLSETWILEYTGDLYGQNVEVELYDFLRPETRFASLTEMQAAIRRNAQQAQSCTAPYR